MIRKIFYSILFLIVAVFLFGCIKSIKDYQPKTSDEAAIKTFLMDYQNSVIKHDVEDVLELIHKDAQIMIGREQNIFSKEQYAKYLQERFKQSLELEFHSPDKIRVEGNKATVKISFSSDQVQMFPITFYLVKENDKWLLKKTEHYIQTSSSLEAAGKFDTNIPIEQAIVAVQESFRPKKKAYHVKHLGKYFPITNSGKIERGVAPLEMAQNVIPILLPLLNENHPRLLLNTIETLSHIVQNYPKETYKQIYPHIEKMINTPDIKVARKVKVALANMDIAYKWGK